MIYAINKTKQKILTFNTCEEAAAFLYDMDNWDDWSSWLFFDPRHSCHISWADQRPLTQESLTSEMRGGLGLSV